MGTNLGKAGLGGAGLGKALGTGRAAGSPFAPSREDGRSDRQVVFDLVEASEPDTHFTHDEIAAALSEGLDDPVDRRRVYPAVAQANRTLLAERQRYLGSVRGKGYRVIRASESVGVALEKKKRSQTMIKRGLEVLRETRLDELDDAQRTLHQGQLMIMAGLHEATKESDRRHARSEDLIAQLTARIDKIEQAG